MSQVAIEEARFILVVNFNLKGIQHADILLGFTDVQRLHCKQGLGLPESTDSLSFSLGFSIGFILRTFHDMSLENLQFWGPCWLTLMSHVIAYMQTESWLYRLQVESGPTASVESRSWVLV